MASGPRGIGGKRPRHQPSTIDRLEPEIQKMINELRMDRGWTIREIMDQLQKLGQGHISRSALGRHVRSLGDMSAELREAQTYATAIAKEHGSTEVSAMLDVNAQFLMANMLKLIMAAKDGEGVQLSTKEAQEFSGALEKIARMRKAEGDVLDQAEERGARRERKAAAARAGAAAKSKGLTAETVDFITNAVLGVAT